MTTSAHHTDPDRDLVRTAPARRAVLRAAGLSSAAGLAGTVGTASASAVGYVPAHYRGEPLLPAAGRHLVSRFSYGLTPALAAQVRRRGGARAWFEWQLTPRLVADHQANRLRDWWEGLAHSGLASWQRQVDGVEAGWQLMDDYGRWLLVRRMTTQRQVLEVMTEFWENHFNVPAVGDAQFVHRTSYGEAIRAKALTSFEELLRTAVLHPAMLIYLDQAVSTAEHPNENLGRELLELHTVGRTSGYTEDDVKSSARILTGYRVDVWGTWTPSYRPRSHWVGPVQVLGFSETNADRDDGRALVDRYLTYLAHHPATAARIVRKLAVKFVSDEPSQALVDQLTSVYLDNGTQVRPVLRALVESAEFQASEGAKLRDPCEDVVASYRALGIRVRRPTAGQSAANAVLWQAANLGATPQTWPRPDGQPLTNDAWASPTRLTASLGLHLSLSGGWWPEQDVDYRTARHWIPEFPIRFDRLVDHLSQVLLHRRSTPTLLQACCEAVSVPPEERITRDHAVATWNLVRLLTTFLDSPTFFLR